MKKIPSTKFQTPNKFQISKLQIPKKHRRQIGILEIGIYLGFGYWDLRFALRVLRFNF